MTSILLPGIGNSGAAHWQTRWERTDPTMIRFRPSSWDAPMLDDWMRALDEAVRSAEQAPFLIAHSLACLLVVHWAAVSPAAPRVAGAFLVAVPDPASAAFPHDAASSFIDVPNRMLPFPALVVASTDDPYAGIDVAARRARDWGAGFVEIGACGHINGTSGLGDWPEGARLLEAFKAGTTGADRARRHARPGADDPSMVS